MMDFEYIIANISTHITLTKEEEQYFISLLEPKALERKEFLLQERNICKHLAFVNKGCLKSFLHNKTGSEYILTFATKNWWIGDINSLITQTPGSLFIEAIEKSEIILLSRKNQEKLYSEIPKFERLFRILMENAFAVNQERIIDTMSLTAEERFLKFCKRYPSLETKLPRKQIAAYLGITPEFFSRMYSKMLDNKQK